MTMHLNSQTPVLSWFHLIQRVLNCFAAFSQLGNTYNDLNGQLALAICIFALPGLQSLFFSHIVSSLWFSGLLGRFPNSSHHG